MTDTITLPRAVLERALKALERADRIAGYKNNWAETVALIAALEQPQDHSEQRLDMVPADWKLVPVEPTSEMIAAGKESMQYSIAELPAFTCYNAMLRAAPQPPTLEQPQVEQEPVAWMFQHEETGRIMYVDAQQVEWGFEQNNPRLQKIYPVYLHPQPPRQPLTALEIEAVVGILDMSTPDWVTACARAIERAHGITGEQE